MSLKKGEVTALRKIYGETLAELGKTREDIVVVDADLSHSTMTMLFQKACPDRFFNAGIAEQDAIGLACGLSTCNKTAFVSTFAIFATGRAYDQVRNTLAYSYCNVKIVATHAGITVGEDGATHQALEDVALMRAVPGMEIFVPCDGVETKAVIKYVSETKKPTYVRLPRTNLPTLFDEEEYQFNPYEAKILKDGSDLTIITNGETTIECLNAAEMLMQKGINAQVINMHCIKPLDCEIVIKAAKKTNKIFTVENHSIIGGLGSAVCECLSENYPAKVHRIGINDEFAQSGPQRELMKFYKLCGEDICETILNFNK
ncbi:MAG: transketolase family protein [Candidatus Gastranaerophilales bacterium]|nr:transketolase family protein [Candidatus Gastranaerophilales bacterium]